MENLERVKDALKQLKNGTIIFEKEEDGKLYLFILDTMGEGHKTSVELSKIEEYDGREDELVSMLEYSSMTSDDIEFFNLRKGAYKLLNQSALVALKKYINKIDG